jgi:hypothetical protein
MVLIGFPVINFIYWPQILRSGVLPSDGDSIGIPMGMSVITTLLLSPVILGVSWLCLRRYNPKTRLVSWRPDRPYRSFLVSLVCGAAVAFAAVGALEGFGMNLPWYDYLSPAYVALWLPWLLALRAAAIEQLDYEPTYTER